MGKGDVPIDWLHAWQLLWQWTGTPRYCSYPELLHLQSPESVFQDPYYAVYAGRDKKVQVIFLFRMESKPYEDSHIAEMIRAVGTTRVLYIFWRPEQPVPLVHFLRTPHFEIVRPWLVVFSGVSPRAAGIHLSIQPFVPFGVRTYQVYFLVLPCLTMLVRQSGAFAQALQRLSQVCQRLFSTTSPSNQNQPDK